jgi:4-nitrophenyl phosphatase
MIDRDKRLKGSEIEALILDMDGVLWQDSEPIGELPAIFISIRKMGLKFAFVTNNATLTANQYVEKLSRFGVKAETDQIINSAQATAEYLKKIYPHGGSVYVIGEVGLLNTLADYGFHQSDREPLAVISGLDRDLTYDKLRRATLFIRQGSIFIGTNPDSTLPTPEGPIPGAGSILAALEVASGYRAIVIGKPHPEMYLLALARLDSSPAESLVVGDRLETDIAGGQAIGCQTALVLSGVTTESTARSWQPPPTFIAPDLTSLLSEYLK